jgi:N-acetylmuramoyl-L-alanine amidase
MATEKVLGAIVAGCLIAIATLSIKDLNTLNQSAQDVEYPDVTYIAVESMPVRETVNIDERQLECMALNIYFEARNQSADGMAAVGFVVINRVKTKNYPDTICKVIYQRKQFSWTSDKSLSVNVDNILELKKWKMSQGIARQIMFGLASDNTSGATHYHAKYVTPSWSRSSRLLKVADIGSHIFYRDIKIFPVALSS